MCAWHKCMIALFTGRNCGAWKLLPRALEFLLRIPGRQSFLGNMLITKKKSFHFCQKVTFNSIKMSVSHDGSIFVNIHRFSFLDIAEENEEHSAIVKERMCFLPLVYDYLVKFTIFYFFFWRESLCLWNACLFSNRQYYMEPM